MAQKTNLHIAPPPFDETFQQGAVRMVTVPGILWFCSAAPCRYPGADIMPVKPEQSACADGQISSCWERWWYVIKRTPNLA